MVDTSALSPLSAPRAERESCKGIAMTAVKTDPVKQQVAAHWGRRAAHFDEDFGHTVRTTAERAAWDRIFDLVLAGRGAIR